MHLQDTIGDPCNGLDRIDSSGIYEKDNVVGCCAACNFIKGSRSTFEFLTSCASTAADSETVRGLDATVGNRVGVCLRTWPNTLLSPSVLQDVSTRDVVAAYRARSNPGGGKSVPTEYTMAHMARITRHTAGMAQ